MAESKGGQSPLKYPVSSPSHSTIATVAPSSCEQLKNFFPKLRDYSGSRTTCLAICLVLCAERRKLMQQLANWLDTLGVEAIEGE